MADFHPFAAAVKAQFDKMSQGELFVVDIDGDKLYEHYLAAFPEGTNPIFRERTEHDCSCCKNFIRNLGNVVAIGSDGNLQTVWDDASVLTLDYPYNVVSQQLAAIVRGFPIMSLFRTKEHGYGAESTIEALGDGKTRRWNHFHAKIAFNHFNQTPDAVKGDYAATVQVFRRGLEELSPVAIVTIIDLVREKALYRGEEHLPLLKGFHHAQAAYLALTSGQRNTFVWQYAGEYYARFRNTVIGTLIQDLSSGMDLEQAVKGFETKVAPANYKRPTALITPRMIEDAMKTVDELGLKPALERRMATLADVSVNNVLWVDSGVRGKMKDGLTDLLMTAVQAAPIKVSEDKAEPISIDDFMANILPKAKSMELFVRNAHLGNFMTLTAPAHPEPAQLFKWGNDFAWSYSGNVADSELRQKVQALGGRVDGVLRFSHTWNYAARNASLMDLHVFLPGSSPHQDGQHDHYPSGPRVGWNRRKDGPSGGVQDVDYTNAAPEGYVPVENTTFPSMSQLKEGKYVFKIHNWRHRTPTLGGFKAEIEFGGQVYQYERTAPLKDKEWVTVAEATLKNGEFTIEHKMSTTTASRDQWGIKTEQFAKVQTVMFSPNYWDDNAVGNKHWFFLLDGCKNPEATRGIYNEFLHGRLDKHRKVFEVLGDKTKCQPTDDQLSGIGFSSTRGDSVLVQVTGDKLRKLYNITF